MDKENKILSSEKLSVEHALDKKSVSGKKTVVVGIVPRDKEILLVKTEKKKNHQTLTDYNLYPIPEGVKKENLQYADILNKAVTSFCKADKRYETWCSIPTINVDTRFLSVPTVKPGNMFNAVFWSYKNESALDVENTVFDFHIIGKAVEDGVDKTHVMAYTAPVKVIDETKTLFDKARIRLDGISIPVFGIQNLLQTRFLEPVIQTVCTLFIGHDWSRIDIFNENHLYLSRDIKTGYKSFLQSIEDQLAEDEKMNVESGQAADDFFINKLVHSEIPKYKDNEHFSRIEPVTDRLVKQIERTFEYFVANFNKTPVKKIYLTGSLCDFHGLIDYLSEKLNISVEVIDVFKGSAFKDNPIFQLKLVSDVYLPAFGMSLSDQNITPNLIHTFKDRLEETRTRRLNIGVVAAAMVVLCVLAGVIFWQKSRIFHYNKDIGRIQAELDELGPPVTEQMIDERTQQIQAFQKNVSAAAQRFLPVAAVSEVCRLAMDNVRLINMTVSNSGTREEGVKLVTTRGYVFEEALALDAALAGYREKLSSSPLFSQTNVMSKTLKIVNGKEVILFEMQMNLLEDM